MEEYLGVIQASDDPGAVETLGMSITETANNILEANPEKEITEDVYLLLENVETVLLCDVECGEAVEILVILFYFILFYFILFYFILFYFILFYFIKFISSYCFLFVLSLTSSHQKQTDRIQLGASFDKLENLKVITIGNSVFTLPKSISELQDSLGGRGACVQVGYSLIDLVDSGNA